MAPQPNRAQRRERLQIGQTLYAQLNALTIQMEKHIRHAEQRIPVSTMKRIISRYYFEHREAVREIGYPTAITDL